MAEPHHPTLCYPSTHYVESAGAIQFIQATASHPEHRVIIVWYPGRNGYLLAKGRRNIQEARAQAAVSERPPKKRASLPNSSPFVFIAAIHLRSKETGTRLMKSGHSMMLLNHS